MGREDKALRVREYRRKGEPFVWMSGGAIALGIVMIITLVGLVFAQGASTFWPKPIELYTLGSGRSFLANVQSVRELDIRDLPLQEDGTPWERDEFPEAPPSEYLLRLGNKKNPSNTIVGWRESIGAERTDKAQWSDRNEFYWAKSGIPKLEEYKEGNPSGYQSVALSRLQDSENLAYVHVNSLKLGDDDDLVRALVSGEVIGKITKVAGSEVDGSAEDALKSILSVQASESSTDATFEIEALTSQTFTVPVAAFVCGHQLRSVNKVIQFERLEGGPLVGWLVAVNENGETLATLEEDGNEKLASLFTEKLEKAQAILEEREEVNEVDLAHVNHEIRELNDEIKRITYDFRGSRYLEAASSGLSTLYNAWSKRDTSLYATRSSNDRNIMALKEGKETQELTYKTDISEEELAEDLEAWRAELDKDIEVWGKEFDETVKTWSADEGSGINESEREAIEELKELYAERGRFRATEYSALNVKMNRLKDEEVRYSFVFERLDGARLEVLTSHIVRTNQINSMSSTETIGLYLTRVYDFLTQEPREAGTEGGIFEIIIGTLLMTILMSLAVVPFGVVAALYLREYARQGPLVSAVRISVNNLAGVPSIVFGIFGLGFFCTLVGGQIDDWFYPWKGGPTFGGGGLLWASLTLALLTIPVVVVATEEALASVPSAQREASLACGASKFQTIWRVILPQSLPGILTGTILAMARGAGEVAPLMLVGVIAYAQDLPVDGESPFLHLERKFMHLGFHIYNNGFKSPNVDQTKPLVFSTAMVLLALVGFLNVFAIKLRNRLRKKLSTSHV